MRLCFFFFDVHRVQMSLHECSTANNFGNDNAAPPLYSSMVNHEESGGGTVLVRRERPDVPPTGSVNPTLQRSPESQDLPPKLRVHARRADPPIQNIDSSSRQTSINCVDIPEPEKRIHDRPIATNGAVIFSSIATPKVPPLVPPSSGSSSGMHAIYERTSFVLRREEPRPPSCSLPVYLHIYDLTMGLICRHSTVILGRQIPGLYHSAIVCFGLEAYFEGGIAIAAAGRSRFGSTYHSLLLGHTTKGLPEYLAWIRVQERSFYQVHDYHITRHNCHHFTNRAAAFLVGADSLIPSYLFSTLKDFTATAQGATLTDALQLFTRGYHCAAARWLRMRILERKSSMDIILQGAVYCGVSDLPPTVVFVFRVNKVATAKASLETIAPLVNKLITENVVKPEGKDLWEKFNMELLRGYDTLDPITVSAFLDIVAEGMVRSPPALRGPLLNALRVSILHQVVLISSVFHAKLMSAIMLSFRDYQRLLPDGRVALLRLACNFSCGSHGAILITDHHYQGSWVSLVGMALLETSPALVYVASCLAVNVVIAVIISTSPSLGWEMNLREHHATLRLATILLHTLRYRTEQQLPEPSFSMVLVALFRLMTSNSVALEFTRTHPCQLKWAYLLKRSQSNESRVLLSLMKAIVGFCE